MRDQSPRHYVAGMPESRNVHPTVPLTDPDGNPVEIDEALAPLIEVLWRSGFTTHTCCQDRGEAVATLLGGYPHLAAEAQRYAGCASVEFPIDDGLAVLDALANSGPRDAFYVRMTHWAAPNAWDISTRPDDQATDDESLPSAFDLWAMSISFPRSDLPEIMRRLEAHERGERVPPGPIDWSTVEVE